MKIAEDLTQILEECRTMEQQHMTKDLPPKSKARYEVKLTNTGPEIPAMHFHLYVKIWRSEVSKAELR